MVTQNRSEHRNFLMYVLAFLCSGRYGSKNFVFGPVTKPPTQKFAQFLGAGNRAQKSVTPPQGDITQPDSQLYMAAKYKPSIVSISSLFVCVVVFWWSMHSSSMYVCCLQLPVIRYQLAGGWSGNSPLVVCPQQLLYIANHLTSCVVSLPSTDRYLQLHYH